MAFCKIFSNSYWNALCSFRATSDQSNEYIVVLIYEKELHSVKLCQTANKLLLRSFSHDLIVLIILRRTQSTRSFRAVTKVTHIVIFIVPIWWGKYLSVKLFQTISKKFLRSFFSKAVTDTKFFYDLFSSYGLYNCNL